MEVAMDATLILFITTQDEWRSRLAERHASTYEVWLPFYKKNISVYLPGARGRNGDGGVRSVW
jgi:hypothetical protein